MSESDFEYDVFLSHSAKDKTVVRDVAERLRKDGVKVWFDEWVLKPGDSIPSQIEEGLERSRVPARRAIASRRRRMLCISANAFGSDWAQLACPAIAAARRRKSGSFRFRDPLNKERRFLPLRLDDAPIKGSLAQFLYINWLAAVREQEYAKLLEACRQPETWPVSNTLLSAYFLASAKEQDDSLVVGYSKAAVEKLLADCNQMIHCLAGFDTMFLMSPQGAAQQARQIDDEWLKGFNHTHEMLCLAAAAREVDFEAYKELAISAYAFWQGAAMPKDTETNLKRHFSPGIGALLNLKRVLIVEIANAQTVSPETAPSTKSSIPPRPAEHFKQVRIVHTGSGDIVMGNKTEPPRKVVFTPGPEHISGETARQLSKLVEEIVDRLTVSGGNVGKAYQRVWGDFNEHFTLTTHRELPREKAEEGISYLRQWRASKNSKLRFADPEKFRTAQLRGIWPRSKALSLTDSDLYSFAFQKLKLKVPISSLNELGNQQLAKLNRFLIYEEGKLKRRRKHKDPPPTS